MVYKVSLFTVVINLQNGQKQWGLRVYVLSDSASGYISSRPYLGKPATESLPFPAMPFITRIVLHLVNQV